MPEIIVPPKTVQVTFSLEPALNVAHSIELLNVAGQFSGFSEWVYQTAAALSPERLHANRLVDVLEVGVRLEEESWPSFTAWLDEFEVADPYERRDRVLEALLTHARQELEGDLPTSEQLLADRATYLALIERMRDDDEKDESYDLELYQEVHALFTDPPVMHDLVVTHLRAMWDQFVAPEWERNLPMLQESVAAFQTLDFAGMSCAEVVRRVTGRELVEKCAKWQGEASQIVFIPSAHLGPYVGWTGCGETIKLLFGARVPEGVTVRSPELSRSELLMRLNALADETRLGILELLADEDGLSSQEIMERLDLSQSAASRHLRQLAATGYLSVERREGVNAYRLNRKRIDDTFGALKKSVQ
ncbi:MAG: winged helix-turn-helix transcriptional regulator [Anaerolineae bacterium]|nr:winged helix-turn-helix transcriptional regulator [Anaerolineae bacterium]